MSRATVEKVPQVQGKSSLLMWELMDVALGKARAGGKNYVPLDTRLDLTFLEQRIAERIGKGPGPVPTGFA